MSVLEILDLKKIDFTENLIYRKIHEFSHCYQNVNIFIFFPLLAKVGKENQGATPITLEVAKETSRIKKHVSSVIDRITKGSRIQDDKNRIEAQTPIDFNFDKDEVWTMESQC